MRIVYSPKYNIQFLGLENLHPFDTKKYAHVWSELEARFGVELKKIATSPEKPLDHDKLAAVHSEAYLEKIKNTAELAEILEIGEVQKVPFMLVDQLLLKSMRWACSGTMLGASEAIKHGCAVNLGGGYHHAGPDFGGGFCVYSDIAMAIHGLRFHGLLSDTDTVAYIDLDAHQGDGVSHIYMNDSRVQMFDMYSHPNFPDDEKAIDRLDWHIPVDRGWSSEDYILEMKEKLPDFLNAIVEESGEIGFAIYNAGTDVFMGDPLGGLNVTADDVLVRDLFVIEELRSRGIPTLMLLSGGYAKFSYKLVADSVSEMITRGY